MSSETKSKKSKMLNLLKQSCFGTVRGKLTITAKQVRQPRWKLTDFCSVFHIVQYGYLFSDLNYIGTKQVRRESIPPHFHVRLQSAFHNAYPSMPNALFPPQHHCLHSINYEPLGRKCNWILAFLQLWLNAAAALWPNKSRSSINFKRPKWIAFILKLQPLACRKQSS